MSSTGTDTTPVHVRSCRWERSFLTYWLSWTTFPSGRTRMLFHLLPAKRSLDLHTIPTESTAGVWSNTCGCTGSGSADNLTPATSFRSHSLLSARSDAQQLCSSGRWCPCSIPLETRPDSLPESTNQLTPAFGAAVAIDGSRSTSLTALGLLANLHSLHVMSPVLSSFPQQNPQLGATSESWWSFTVSWSWRALTCASCCSTLDETGTSSDVLYTQLRTLLDDVWRGPDDRLHSLRTPEDVYGIGHASCPHWTHQSSRLPSDVSLQCMQLWIGAHQTWCGVRVLPLLLWSWGASPLRILSSGCSFVIMLVKVLVTASAFALCMINTLGLCHFFFWHAFPLIIFLTFSGWASSVTLVGWLSACFVILYMLTYHDLGNPFYWDCPDHRLWRAQLLRPQNHRPLFSAMRFRFSLSRSLSIRFFMDWWRKPYDVS